MLIMQVIIIFVILNLNGIIPNFPLAIR